MNTIRRIFCFTLAVFRGVEAARTAFDRKYVQESIPTLTRREPTMNQAISSNRRQTSQQSLRRNAAPTADIFAQAMEMSDSPSQQPTFLLKDHYAIFAFDMDIDKSLEGKEIIIFLQGIQVYVARLSESLVQRGYIKDVHASILSQQAYFPDPQHNGIQRMSVAVKINVTYMGHNNAFDMFSTFKEYMLPNQELKQIWLEIMDQYQSEMPQQAAEENTLFKYLNSDRVSGATKESDGNDLKLHELIIVCILILGVAISSGSHSARRSADRVKGHNLDDQNAFDRMLDRTREFSSEEDDSTMESSFRKDAKSERSLAFSVAESQSFRSKTSCDNETFSVAESQSRQSILSRGPDEMVLDHPSSPIIAIAASDSTEEHPPSPVITIAAKKLTSEGASQANTCTSPKPLSLGDHFEPQSILQIASDSTDEEIGVTFYA